MKSLALVLLLACVGLFYLPELIGPSGSVAKVATGSLPRVANLKSNTAEKAPAPVKSAPEETGPVCIHFGWFESAELAREYSATQSVVDETELSVEEVERERPPLHWIIIPPQPPEVALRQFREMQREGVDSYLVTSGENRNAISLGLFESRESAISVLEEKKRQNLNAVLVNFPRNQISYALSFEAEPELAEDLVRAVKTDYGDNFDFVEIRHCEGVATPKKNP